MSTRATITIYDRFEKFNIYLHNNGVPERVIPEIQKAIQYAWKLPRFEAGDFASAIIRVMKKGAGEIQLIGHLNSISDIEYYYEISTEMQDIKVTTFELKNGKASVSYLY